MESSLISINSASVEDLQKIHGIGPSLAARIIAFRNKSGPIVVKEQLDAVHGLGRKQIDKIAKVADWTIVDPGATHQPASPAPALVISFLVCTILFFMIYPMIELLFEGFAHWENDVSSWFTTLVNSLAISFTASTLILMLGWLLAIFYSQSQAPIQIAKYGLVCSATSLTLLLPSSLICYWVLNSPSDVTAYMINLLVIIAAVLLLVYLHYGPQLLCLTKYHLNEPASVLFDCSLLPIAIVSLVVSLLVHSTSIVVDIFLLWVSVLLIIYSSTLARGRSCYADLLREIFTWPNILQNNPDTAIRLSNTLQKINGTRSGYLRFNVTGWATFVISSLTLLHSLYVLITIILQSIDL